MAFAVAKQNVASGKVLLARGTFIWSFTRVRSFMSLHMFQLSEGPIAHAALLERHDEILSEAMPRVVASVHGVKGSFVARSLR